LLEALLQSTESAPTFKIPHKTGQEFGFLVEIQVLGEDNEIYQAVNGE